MNDEFGFKELPKDPDGPLIDENQGLDSERVLVQPENLPPIIAMTGYGATLLGAIGAVWRNAPANIPSGEGLGLSPDTLATKGLYSAGAVLAVATVAAGFAHIRNTFHNRRAQQEADQLESQKRLEKAALRQ
jgi:hypothetical protein